MRKKQKQCKIKGYLCFLFPCTKDEVSHLKSCWFQRKYVKIERESETILSYELLYLRITSIHPCQPSTTNLLEAVSLVLMEVLIYISLFSHILILCIFKCIFNFRAMTFFKARFNFVGGAYWVRHIWTVSFTGYCLHFQSIENNNIKAVWSDFCQVSRFSFIVWILQTHPNPNPNHLYDTMHKKLYFALITRNTCKFALQGFFPFPAPSFLL